MHFRNSLKADPHGRCWTTLFVSQDSRKFTSAICLPCSGSEPGDRSRPISPSELRFFFQTRSLSTELAAWLDKQDMPHIRGMPSRAVPLSNPPAPVWVGASVC
jgi:hypothetical protein